MGNLLRAMKSGATALDFPFGGFTTIYHLLKMELRETRKIMKIQRGENKNRNNKFAFNEFIHL